MSDQVDQFGRDKSKTSLNNISEDKSKKILETLAEIKNQLNNKDYKPKIDINHTSKNLDKDSKVINSKNLDFDQLKNKIDYLEKRLISLINHIELEGLDKDSQIKRQDDKEKSIFHNFGGENDSDKGRSLLVLEEQLNPKFYKIKLHHFLLITIFFFIILILLISLQLKVNFFEVINIFLTKFN